MGFQEDSRTDREKVIDKLLLLHLLNKSDIDGKTKLQKTVFFSEDSVNEKGIKSFSYNFIRYHHGEFSFQLQSDLEDLRKNNFLSAGRFIKPSSDGRRLLERAGGILDKNPDIVKRVDNIAEFTSNKNLDKILVYAYNRIFKHGKPVGEIPEGIELLHKIEDEKAEILFDLDDGFLNTLEVMLDRKSYDRLKNSINQPSNIPLEV